MIKLDMEDNVQTGGGQFGQALGGVDALRAAAKRRGIDIPQLEQLSASSPQGQELPMPVQGEQNVMSQTPSQQAVGQATGQETIPQSPPFRSSEGELALKAIKSVLDTENAITKSVLKLQGIS